MHRSMERERYLRRPFVQANLWLQHVIAGEPRFPANAEVDAELDREIHAAPPPVKRNTQPPAVQSSGTAGGAQPSVTAGG
jgi:hypothetical protein